MFTEWTKISVWTKDGCKVIYYDELSDFDEWWAYCWFELSAGHIGGFSVTKTLA